MCEYSFSITSGDGVLGGGELLAGELRMAVVKLRLEYDGELDIGEDGTVEVGSGPPAAAGSGKGLGRVAMKSSNKFLGRAALGIVRKADPSDDGMALVGGDGAGLLGGRSRSSSS